MPTTSRGQGLIWLASYPKSGNTWMRILLSNLLSGGDRPEDINALSLRDGIASDRHVFESLTLVDSLLLHPEESEALRPAVHDLQAAEASDRVFVKTHDAYTRLSDGTPVLGRRAQAALYLVRDPRDVAVSFAFHQSMTLDRAVEFMALPNATLCATSRQLLQRLGSWSGHVQGWLDQGDLPVHLIRYEDLRSSTLEVFCGALDFLGIPFRRDAAERAIRHSDFAELQRQESIHGFAERQKDQKAFFREGRAGGWRDHLTEAQVRRIEADHAVVMARLGYDPITKENPS